LESTDVEIGVQDYQDVLQYWDKRGGT